VAQWVVAKVYHNNAEKNRGLAIIENKKSAFSCAVLVIERTYLSTLAPKKGR